MLGEHLCDVLDVCRQGWHSMVWVCLVPLTILLIGPAIRPAVAVHHFTFHRIQHYEVSGSLRGSPGVSLNCEVRTLFSASVARRCLVISWKELITKDISSVVQKGIVALIIAVPQNMNSIQGEDRDAFVETEQTILKMDLQIPVYFVVQTPEVKDWLDSLDFHSGSVNTPQTTTEELLQQVIGDYYYISSSSYSAKAIGDVKMSNLIGRIGDEASLQSSEQQPMIVLVAHLDAIGVAPGLSYGANSDASGVAVLLEIVRILSTLKQTQRSTPKRELLVLISAGGKFNFLGTKKWLSEQVDATESSLLGKIQYAVCLDGVGEDFPPKVYVSRPPKEGSPAHRLFEVLNESAVNIAGNAAQLVHKKINLAEDELTWEHEQFSLVRVPAFSLSSLSLNRISERRSILDDRSTVQIPQLTKTAHWLADALAREMFGLEGNDTRILHDNFLAVSEENIASWLEILTRQPRPLQMLTPDHPVMVAVKDYLTKRLVDFKVKPLNSDKAESDITLYGPVDVVVTASRTKQPFFDLLVTSIIAIYGGLMFLLLQYIDIIRITRSWMRPVVSGSAIKFRNGRAVKYQ
ncbi:BOS complex subunit NCLN-like [Paramacrobiotus metropolitanus]|uniref:BOS complex subunit NCLN-like n=1 Tax=Paramacrobiotus metropolitanus TaxID=2943436 RepID=UPI0024457888|nr:BOS complex subunit NCLN-like [Paramacrobiotus metropolitanus]